MSRCQSNERLEFFNANFGRHLVPQTNRPHADADRPWVDIPGYHQGG